MFQLIVTVISIALVAALAVATLWFGGVVFTDGGEKVDYTRIRNGAFQIEAALNMYFGDRGVYPQGDSETILAELIDKDYLNAVPSGENGLEYRIETNQIVRSLADEQQCFILNKLAGLTTEDECPPCSDESKSHYIACENG